MIKEIALRVLGDHASKLPQGLHAERPRGGAEFHGSRDTPHCHKWRFCHLPPANTGHLARGKRKAQVDGVAFRTPLYGPAAFEMAGAERRRGPCRARRLSLRDRLSASL